MRAASWPPRRNGILNMLLLVVAVATIRGVQGLPWPAPDLHNCIDSPIESCCTPVLYNGTARRFTHQSWLPLRTRQAAHLVDAAFTATIQKAYALMRALPDTDPRSFNNQARLHCAYCDNHFFYPEFPQSRLEIHRNWLFLPWHRLFIYHHERILAKLLGDDTFALPFWDFDNQSEQKPQGNVYPEIYRTDTGFGPRGNSSALFDPLRQVCSAYPRQVDFQDPFQFCPNRTDASQRVMNAHAMYTQIVATPVLPTLFHGQPYRYGDVGAVGGGTIENKPHGSMHVWANLPKATFTNSASDPIFYALHANVDRLWKIWMKVPGGVRTYPQDSDWLNTEFTFYDEDGKTVTAAVHQALDTKLLRYKYQKVPAPWLNKGAVEPKSKPTNWSHCSPHNSSAAIAALIADTPLFRSPLNYTNFTPLTFKLRRPAPVPESSTFGEEVLQIQGNKVNWTEASEWMAFLFMPEAQWHTSVACPEWLGVLGDIPHIGQSTGMANTMIWRAGLRRKLKDLGLAHATDIVVTLAGPTGGPPGPGAPPDQPFMLTSAEIVYQKT